MSLSASLRDALDIALNQIAKTRANDPKPELHVDSSGTVTGPGWRAVVVETGPDRPMVHLDAPAVGEATDMAIALATLKVPVAGVGTEQRPS